MALRMINNEGLNFSSEAPFFSLFPGASPSIMMLRTYGQIEMVDSTIVFTSDGKIQMGADVSNEMVIINNDTFQHAVGLQDFGSGGDHFIMASREGSTETAGVYGDGDHLTFWSPGDGAPGQPNAIAYFLDEDRFNDDAIPHSNSTGASPIIAYLANTGMWTVSDQIQKENITKISGGLHKIMSLQAYEYDLKRSEDEIEKNSQTHHAVGIMAQELKKTIPSAVQTNDNGDHFVNYDMIIPVLIEAIKEQQAEIEELKSRLDR